MDFEYWWLLVFPIFFGLGWIAARIDIKHLISQSRTLPDSYFKGLNFLLNQQQDKAIEAFTEAARIDTETIELHFTLGGLFRRRGEVDRAIRLHQNLVDRADLGKEQKLAATNELAQDFLKAGLLDRAEQLFTDLLQTNYSETALKHLIEIYVIEKDWHQAIAAARKQMVADPSYVKDIAHYYCELAATDTIRADYDAARKHLEEALAVDRRCVRASVLQGEIEASQGNHELAIQAWQRVESQNPAYLTLVASKLLASYRQLGKTGEGLSLLQNYLSKYDSSEILEVLYQATLERQGPEAAYDLIRGELRQNPTLQGLDALLEAQLFKIPDDRRQDMQLVKNLVHQHVQKLMKYRCDNCGFKARHFHWHCPACGRWETFPPRRREDYEV